jgi:hypothetical protein
MKILKSLEILEREFQIAFNETSTESDADVPLVCPMLILQ